MENISNHCASRRRPRSGLVALIAVLTAWQAPVAAEPAAAPPLSGTLLLVTDTGRVPATLLDTDVSMAVNGLVARVSVMQRFENTGSERLEGVYLFPLPDTAAVDRMRIYVGDRLIEGEIREKEEARRDYEAARQAGRKAGLVEQQRANLFATSVANVSPGETVIVEIEYLQEVRFDAGRFSLRFPMTVTPPYEPSVRTDPTPAEAELRPPMVSRSAGHRVSLSATINAGLPLARVVSRYHPVDVGEVNGRTLVTLAAGRARMDRDFELAWAPEPGTAARALVFTEHAAGGLHALLMVVPPAGGTAAQPPVPRDVILVIDTSGSMHGQSLEQAKRAVVLALGRLGAADRFNVIAFSDRARAVFPASVAADPVNVGVAKTFVAGLAASGGTEVAPALALALGMRSPGAALRQLVFVTDGAVSNEEALFALIRERLGDARLFTVGIGSAPNSWFMRRAAESGRGSFTFIGSVDEVGARMDRLLRKLEQPQLTGIEIEWPSGLDVESYPSTVPDLYSGEPVALRVRLGSGLRPGERVRVSGNSPAGAWRQDVVLETGYQSEGVAALWARARIAGLLDARNRGADPERVRREVVATALGHHLVSPFTSLVAVDRTPPAPGTGPARRENIASLRPQGQSAAAIAGFPATATEATARLVSGTLATVLGLLVLGLLSLFRRRAHVVPA